jgi:hypothetical protein
VIQIVKAGDATERRLMRSAMKSSSTKDCRGIERVWAGEGHERVELGMTIKLL